MKRSKPKSVLFLCTGNYYRSRFAEELFNHLAEVKKLHWRAFSRGIEERSFSANVGPISPFTLEGLRAIGVKPKRADQFPRPCGQRDFDRAHLIVALKEVEHRPMMERRFPEIASSIRYWHINDIDVSSPTDVLPVLNQLVETLVAKLESRRIDPPISNQQTRRCDEDS